MGVVGDSKSDSNILSGHGTVTPLRESTGRMMVVGAVITATLWII